MSKRLSRDQKKKAVMLRLSLPVHRAYEKVARQQRRSLSNLLVIILEDCLEEKEKATEVPTLPLGETTCADVVLTP
jgi:hypothetical protein